jgi:hypothetical protein
MFGTPEGAADTNQLSSRVCGVAGVAPNRILWWDVALNANLPLV